MSDNKHKDINRASLWAIFSYFKPFLKPHRQTLTVAGFSMLGMTVMELLRPWPIKLIFDAILIPQKETLTLLENIHPALIEQQALLIVLTLSILFIAIFAGLFGFGQAYLTASVGQRVVAAIRHHLYSHVQRLSHSFHDETALGDLITRLTGDIQLMRELLVTSVIFVCDRSLALLGMVIIMLLMDWQLTLIALSVIPLLFFISFGFNREIKSAGRRQRRKEGKITSLMTEKLSANTLVQAYAREAYEETCFSKQNAKTLSTGLRSTKLEAHLSRIVQVILAIGTAAVLWFGVVQVQAGMLTPGDLLVFTAYLSSMYKPIRKLSALTARIAKATVCGQRILDILKTEPDIKDDPSALPAPILTGDVVFDRVSFSYSSNRPVFNKTSLQIRKGETIALIGPSGAGKSTVGKLLLRFYDPNTGCIKFDGTDIRQYQLESIRNQIAIVLQEPWLFSGSILDNIGYGKLDATEEEIINAAKEANAHEFIELLPEGYYTIISERGSSLSGGQKQRISIARAIIRQAPIVILDEPTTGLDQSNKKQVEIALHRLTQDSTCLLITHDKQTALSADRFILIDKGSLTELDLNTTQQFLNNYSENENPEAEWLNKDIDKVLV
jgi:ABC-type multidrug transport system fused ATPase/permease subunit